MNRSVSCVRTVKYAKRKTGDFMLIFKAVVLILLISILNMLSTGKPDVYETDVYFILAVLIFDYIIELMFKNTNR